ncbi:hypothetical protein AYI70_g3744 [Smittium culicis]|uniref:Uncharacterized protein n=1 Tax=Smittium culicis TaxID=133412 RepID=A0A1R1Y212_9FUNG|nr:hypothetical protein AYI70_g3744 [Smittium culicis]
MEKGIILEDGANLILATRTSKKKSKIISLYNTSPKAKLTATGILGVLAAALLSSGGEGRSQNKRENEYLLQIVGETHKRPLGQIG